MGAFAVAGTGDTPEGVVVIGLKLSAQEYEVGETVTVALEVRGARNVHAVKFHLAYDSEVLRFVPPATEGPFLRSDGTTTVFLAGDDGTVGKLKVGAARLDGGPGISGKGELAEFSFEAVRSGVAELEFEEASVLDPNKENLPARFKNVRVVVND